MVRIRKKKTKNREDNFDIRNYRAEIDYGSSLKPIADGKVNSPSRNVEDLGSVAGRTSNDNDPPKSDPQPPGNLWSGSSTGIILRQKKVRYASTSNDNDPSTTIFSNSAPSPSTMITFHPQPFQSPSCFDSPNPPGLRPTQGLGFEKYAHMGSASESPMPIPSAENQLEPPASRTSQGLGFQPHMGHNNNTRATDSGRAIPTVGNPLGSTDSDSARQPSSVGAYNHHPPLAPQLMTNFAAASFQSFQGVTQPYDELSQEHQLLWDTQLEAESKYLKPSVERIEKDDIRRQRKCSN